MEGINLNTVTLGRKSWRFQDVCWSSVPMEYRFGPSSSHIFLLRLTDHIPWLDRYQSWINEVACDTCTLSAKSPVFQQSVAASVLRHYIVSRYLGVPASEIHFDHSKNGKPELLAPLVKQRLYFSQTHTKAYVMLALSDTPCGLDIESLRSPSAYPNVCSRALPATWMKTLSTYPSDASEQCALFTQYWTLLESLYKIRGDSSLYDFLKTLHQNDSVLDQVEKTDMGGIHFTVGPNHIGCLTFIGGPPSDLSFYQVAAPLLP